MSQSLAGGRRPRVRAGTLVVPAKRSAIRNPGWIPAFAGIWRLDVLQPPRGRGIKCPRCDEAETDVSLAEGQRNVWLVLEGVDRARLARPTGGSRSGEPSRTPPKNVQSPDSRESGNDRARPLVWLWSFYICPPFPRGTQRFLRQGVFFVSLKHTPCSPPCQGGQKAAYGRVG